MVKDTQSQTESCHGWQIAFASTEQIGKYRITTADRDKVGYVSAFISFNVFKKMRCFTFCAFEWFKRPAYCHKRPLYDSIYPTS